MRHNVTFKTNIKINLDEQSPGEKLAVYISSRLSEQGIETGIVENFRDFAWSLDVTISDVSLYAVVGLIDDGPFQWLLQIQSDVGFFARLFGANPAPMMDKLSEYVHKGLSSDANFSEIRWHEGEYGDDWTADPSGAKL